MRDEERQKAERASWTVYTSRKEYNLYRSTMDFNVPRDSHHFLLLPSLFFIPPTVRRIPPLDAECRFYCLKLFESEC